MLTLPIKKQWFDMIRSGEKTEEYRERSSYYYKRFRNVGFLNLAAPEYKAKICFRNGYGKGAPAFVASCTLSIGTGKPEWGAEEGKEYYVLRIKRIEEDEG
jgi:hypothetical protein